MNRGNLQRLAKLRRVDFLLISLNDHRPQEYERIMRLPFDRTLARLDGLHELKTSGAVQFPVLVSRVGDATGADDEFLRWASARYPAFYPMVTVRSDWIGMVRTPIGPAPDVACRTPAWVHPIAQVGP